LQSLSAGHSPSIVTVRAHYDLTTPATITLYRGRVGDSSESVLCQSGTLSGSGTFECTDVLELGARSWYRAMANDPPFDQVAYTNPVFFLPGGCAHATYGTGLGGANIASLSSSSSPAIGSVINLEMAGFDNSSTVFLVLSLVDVPGGIPFKGGSLLVGAPLLLQLPLPLTSGKFDLALQIPYDENLIGGHVFWQAVAPDPTLPAGFALSNGLDTGICAAFP
jgi:hypothetical protein